MTTSAPGKAARRICYMAGGIFMLIGVFSLLHPFWVIASTAVLMGIGFLVSGINRLVPYLTMKNAQERPEWLLPMSVVDIAFGLFFLSHIGLAFFTLSTLLGVWVILCGCVRGYAAFRLRSAGARKWWVMLASGALLMLLGSVLLSNPFAAGKCIAPFAGSLLIGIGLLSIAEGRMLYPPPPRP